MSNTSETGSFLNDLGRVAQFRAKISNSLANMANTIEKAELEGENQSGKLALAQDIEDLRKTSKNLKEGIFRLLVLGDMKRGKSTLLNVLIGENLLPSDVNPCTALLTILRYGKEKQVTIHYNDGTTPTKIDFPTFKQQYTIDPTEAKKLEKENKQAFPNVDYAVVEYPLPLLEKGVEIVDSPGLNDTEARNELSLGYVNNCHAILFVLRASQPCTLAERRYLENYIKERGLTVFFLINAWDQVKESLIDPDDIEELRESEEKLRRVFQTNLADYCYVDGYDLYDERVFELSSLMALRRRLKNSEASLEGTGFPQFLLSLNTFLTQERAVSFLRQARIVARQSYQRVRETVQRRVVLIEKDVNQLKQQVDSVEPEFNKLHEIRDKFQGEIQTKGDQKARSIADSFRDYILNLENTFESDFFRYQPELKFLDFLSSGKREAFERELKKAFERYINDKLSEWSLTAEKEMRAAFDNLSRSATQYGTSYQRVTEKITEKLTGYTLPPLGDSTPEDNSPTWAKWAAGIFSLSRGNLAGLAMAGAGFDWKNIILNFITVLGIGGLITLFTGVVLGPIGIALLGLGVGVIQADQARNELVKATKKQLVKYLPQFAQQQWQPVYNAVKECFDVYEREVTERIDKDIQSRRSELNNLVRQKQSFEINQGAEIKRLQHLENTLEGEFRNVETTYQDFLKG